LDEIVPKEGSYRDQITYVKDRPGTIVAMQLMQRKLVMS
jgi:dTDP-D-glucose 4,6-dehydratase